MVEGSNGSYFWALIYWFRPADLSSLCCAVILGLGVGVDQMIHVLNYKCETPDHEAQMIRCVQRLKTTWAESQDLKTPNRKRKRKGQSELRIRGAQDLRIPNRKFLQRWKVHLEEMLVPSYFEFPIWLAGWSWVLPPGYKRTLFSSLPLPLLSLPTSSLHFFSPPRVQPMLHGGPPAWPCSPTTALLSPIVHAYIPLYHMTTLFTFLTLVCTFYLGTLFQGCLLVWPISRWSFQGWPSLTSCLLWHVHYDTMCPRLLGPLLLSLHVGWPSDWLPIHGIALITS